MRALWIALALVLAAPAFAEEPRDVLIPVRVSLLSPQMQPDLKLALGEINQDALRSARGLEIAGMVLALAGTAMVLSTPIAAEQENAPAMIGLGTAGALSFLIGLPLWIAGDKALARQKRAKVYLMTNGVAF